MNTIYEIGLPKNDFEGAMMETSGLFLIPKFKCTACGYVEASRPIWYASVKPNSPEAAQFCEGVIPETVGSPEDYVAFCKTVRAIFKTNARLLPGSVVGARLIEVKSRKFIGSLTTKKASAGVDFAWADLFNCVVSPRIFELLRDCGLDVPNGPIELHTGDGTIVSGYKVLELEPEHVWTQAERDKYGLTVCNLCGAVHKKVNRGTFAMKQFNGDLFKDGYALRRGNEEAGFYINQKLHDRLTAINPTGTSFRKAGEWA